jgi:hypothetical protein
VCTLDPTNCGTGKAGGTLGSSTPYDWFCADVVPAGALPNGAGEYCYVNQTSCLLGPSAHRLLLAAAPR